MQTQTPETRERAPGALETVQAFLNSGNLAGVPDMTPMLADEIRQQWEAGTGRATLSSEYGIDQKLISALARGALVVDELGTAETAGAWLAERGLLAPDSELIRQDLEDLQALREALRSLALVNNGQPLEPWVTAELNRLAREATVAIMFNEAGGARLDAQGVPGRQAIGGLLAIVYEAMHAGTWQRLKRCVGDGCPHTFYDTSRNRSGTWCSMSVCGNRRKVRAYQERRRAPGSSGQGGKAGD